MGLHMSMYDLMSCHHYLEPFVILKPKTYSLAHSAWFSLTTVASGSNAWWPDSNVLFIASFILDSFVNPLARVHTPFVASHDPYIPGGAFLYQPMH